MFNEGRLHSKTLELTENLHSFSAATPTTLHRNIFICDVSRSSDLIQAFPAPGTSCFMRLTPFLVISMSRKSKRFPHCNCKTLFLSLCDYGV